MPVKTKETRPVERRKAPRVAAAFGIKFTDGSEGSTADLSQSGARLVSQTPLGPDNASIRLLLPFKPLTLKVKTVWSRQNPAIKEFIYGVKFLEITEEDLSLLRKTLAGKSQIDQAKKDPTAGLDALKRVVFEQEKVAGNIENLIGAAQVPVGLAGPIKVKGDHAKGLFYVPFATTEGTLVSGYTLGMIALTRGGGVSAKVLSHKVDITPVFEFADLLDAAAFAEWIKNNFTLIKSECEKTTRHGKLLELKPLVMGKRVYVYFVMDSGDAMGLNMISIATYQACEMIKKSNPSMKKYYLRSNLSADKKQAYSNFIHGYGKEVAVEILLKKEIVKRYLNTTPEAMCDFWYTSVLSGFQAGTVGHNAHYANALAAIYIACGQDVAQIVNSSMGVSGCEVTEDKDLYAFLRLPCVIIGTLGGGTHLDTQKECLEIMDCYGEGKSDKLAEIIGATLLAGEISICAGLASGEFIKAHIRKRALGNSRDS